MVIGYLVNWLIKQSSILTEIIQADIGSEEEELCLKVIS